MSNYDILMLILTVTNFAWFLMVQLLLIEIYRKNKNE